jgi:hypothetical protein
MNHASEHPSGFAPFGWKRLHEMGWTPRAALRVCSPPAHPIPSPTLVQESVVFLFLMVDAVGYGPLMLIAAVGVCLVVPQGFCPPGCFCLLALRGAPGLLPALRCSSSSLQWVCWRLSFGAVGLLVSLPLGGCGLHVSYGPSAASAHGWCCFLSVFLFLVVAGVCFC